MSDLQVGLTGADLKGFQEELVRLQSELSTHHPVDILQDNSKHISSAERGVFGRPAGDASETGQGGSLPEGPDGAIAEVDPGTWEPIEQRILLIVEPDMKIQTSFRWLNGAWQDPHDTSYQIDTSELVEHLLSRVTNKSGEPICRLTVDGNPVPLKWYPRSVLMELVRGLVRSLSGVKPGREYQVYIRTNHEPSDRTCT